ncbi:MAG: DUF4340 domain-containing protein [Opitutales bacterium]
MRTKHLLITTLALGLAALAVLNLSRKEPPAAPSRSPLVEPTLLAEAVRVEVRANGKSATLEKDGGGAWTVKEKLGLPADVDNRLGPLLRSLQKAESLGVLTTNPKRIERLGFGETVVTLTAPGGRTWSAEIGRTTDDGSGSAVRLKGAPEALRTTFSGYVEGDPASWFDPLLHSRPPEEVKSVTLTAADGSVSGTRPEKGQPFPGKEAGVLENIVSSLATLRATDALAKDDGAAKKAFEKPVSVKLEFFDGATLTVQVGRTAGASANDQPRLFVRPAHSETGHRINSLTAKAEFAVSGWLAEQVPATVADFRKAVDPPPPAPPVPPQGDVGLPKFAPPAQK